MKRSFWLLPALIIPLLLGRALAAEKITVDPNTPEARAAAQSSDSDPRLAQKISYTCKATPIREVIAELSTRSGVTLVAGNNSSDWPVRDAKVTMFMKDAPLVEIMNSIARVMKFAWSRSGDAPKWSYRLVNNNQAVQDLEDRMNGKSKEMIAKRRNLIAQLEKVAVLSEPEIKALEEKNSYLYVMAKMGIAAPFTNLLRQVPGLSSAIINEETFCVSAADLPKHVQSTLVDLVRQSYKMIGGNPEYYNEKRLNKMLAKASEWSIRYDNMNDPEHGENSLVMGLYGLLMIESENMGDVGGVPLGDPDNPFIQVMSKYFMLESQYGQEKGPQLSDEEQMIIARAEVDAYCLEPSVKHDKDPELQTKINAEAYFEGCNEWAEYMSGACGFSFITDDYKVNEDKSVEYLQRSPWVSEYCDESEYDDDSEYSEEPVKPEEPEEVELQKYLETCTTYSPLNWQRHGSVIEIWDRNWYKSRKGEMPDGLMEKWEKQIQETGTLDINCLAEIAALTEKQLDVNIYDDELFYDNSNLLSRIDRNRDYLTVYNQLSKYQRTALFTSKGLALSDLNSRQREALFAIITGLDIPEGYPDLSAAGLDLRATATSEWDGQRYIYTITGSINGVAIPGSYIISSPVFEFRTREELKKYYEEMEEEYYEDGYYEEDYSDEDYYEEDCTEEYYDEPYDESSEYSSDDSYYEDE